MRPPTLLAAALAVLALLAPACGQAVGNPGVAVVVNGEEISVAALSAALEAEQEGAGYQAALQSGADGAQQEAETTTQVLSLLVITALFEQATAELGVEPVTDADVDARLQQIAEQEFGGMEGFESFVEQEGLTLDNVLTQVRLIELQDRITAAVGADVEVSDADIQAFYDEQVGVATISHIFVASAEEAQQALDRIEQGEPFEQVALQLSQDQTTAQQGGNLGPFQPGLFGEAFDIAVSELGEGEVSGVVESDFGFHVIRRNPIPPLDDVLRSQITQQLTQQAGQQATQDFFNSLLFDAEVTVNPRFGTWDPLQQGVVAGSVLGALTPSSAEPGLGVEGLPPGGLEQPPAAPDS